MVWLYIKSMTILLIAFVVIVLIVLFRYMTYSNVDSLAYVPPKVNGNRPFPEQAKIKEN